MSRKRKSVTIDHEEHKKTKKRKEQKGKDAAAGSCSYLPEELIIENILTRLSVRDLAQYSCVSKLWYNSIIKDTRFAASHFAHQKQKKELDLCFNLTNVSVGDSQRNCFFSLQNHTSDDESLDLKLLAKIDYEDLVEPVGYCNGLSCYKSSPSEPVGDRERGSITVVNPVTSGGEALHIPYYALTNQEGGSLKYLCSGFGFDLSSEEYKVVLNFTSSTTAGDQLFISKVYALGANSWRKVVTSTSNIKPPPGCPPFPSTLVTRAWKNTCKSATLCGGELVWRVINGGYDDGYEVEMLLSFDIHNENLHFIGLPTECSSLIPTTSDEHQSAEVGHHLLEFKGYPCVARTEKIIISNTDHHHRRRRHCKHQSGFCCYRFNVHLYILKGKVKQTWVKEQSFDVRMKDEGLVPDPLCCYFDTTTTGAPATRVLGFSDQVLLYWFDGKCLVFYNLQKKHLNVVRCSRSCNRDTFVTDEMKGMPLQDRRTYVDDNPNYQLHAQLENLVSLRSFWKEGKFYDFYQRCDLLQFMENRSGFWLTRLKKLPGYCAMPFQILRHKFPSVIYK